jgi:rhodanese-related sulfurtransferase
MTFKNALLTISLTLALTGAAGAQTDKHTHDHGSVKGADSKKASAETAKQMTASDLKQRLDKGEKVIILDARHDLAGQIIKGALQVTSDKLENWAKDVDKSAVIVTYCTCPHDEAADAEMNKLREMGFSNAYSLAGGLDAARKAGIEIVAPSTAEFK